MPDLLLELLSEEIPARMQAQAAVDLERLVAAALHERGLPFEGAKAFVTPRRLALSVDGLPARQPDRREERRGPRVGAPQAAIDGFLKSTGLASLEAARVVDDPKKGKLYAAVVETPGRATADVLAEALPGVVRAFPWPKAMRWGARSAAPGSLSWVRPLHSILCTFGPETEEPAVVPFEVGGLVAGNVTAGHRFMAPAPFAVRRFEDYADKLARARVMLDPAARMDTIRQDARDRAFALGLAVVEDEALLAEVAGLVEWPVVLIGTFEARFLAIPEAVVRATIRANQKCFVLRDAQGRLAPRFAMVANLEARDGGATVVAGNERVVRARLSDALYFWETDRKPLPGYPPAKPLDQRLAKLRALNVVFHEKLGTQGERVDRLVSLAGRLAPLVGADPGLARRAAELCKADLVTEVVGEFPETQGQMGGRYAALQGEPAEVADAIAAHYRPQGPSDAVPSAPVAIAVALADKLDTLVGFWAIGETPTGSKDPYALRRAALGVVRIVLENGLRLRLAPLGAGDALLAFFADRLKTHLREHGARHDLIDAVFALPGQDDLLAVVRRVEALGAFLATEAGAALLAGYRRAANILRAEEKKDGPYDGAYDASRLDAPEEQALADALGTAMRATAPALAAEEYAAAMAALAALRGPVDAFFEAVTVNAPEAAARANRLRLLAALRHAMHAVADFSKVAG